MSLTEVKILFYYSVKSIEYRVLFLAILILTLFTLTLKASELDCQEESVRRESGIADSMVCFTGDGITTSFELPRNTLTVDSVKIRAIIDTIDYEYEKRELIFSRPPEQDTTIEIYIKILDVKLPKSYMHRKQRKPQETDTVFQISPQEESALSIMGKRETYSDIIKGGNLTRGFSFGTGKGLLLNSGLRMQLSGQLSEELEINASLTDQNTPLQPEGNTQTLQEIDKVFVQIKGRNLQSNFGDYRLEFTESLLGRYSRKLQGVMLRGDVKNNNILVSTSISEGDYHRNYFMGQEGNQGSYQLMGKNGEKDIIVLAGTEKVWVDGMEMKRGEDHDYIIEYALGQITFTRRRLITSYSRIEVDFQYTRGRFKRNLYAVQASGNIKGNNVRYYASFIRESDNKSSPMGESLSDEERRKLEKIGDDFSAAVKEGAEFVGEGNGNYIVKDTLGTQVYYYAGNDNGSYNVKFSDVGEGKGNYLQESFGVYRWVGEGKGRYLPVDLLPMAQSHNLWDFKLEYNNEQNFVIDGEIALSNLDLNRFSAVDDGDNLGRGINFNVNLNEQEVSLSGVDLGTISINSAYRNLNNNFKEIDRIREVEFNRKWYVNTDTLKGEDLFELTAAYEPVEDVNLRFEGGKISYGASSSSVRKGFDFAITREKIPDIRYRGEYIDSKTLFSNKWGRQRGNIIYREGKIQPFLNFEYENKKETVQTDSLTGYKFLDVGTGINFIHSKNLEFKSIYNIRKDQSYTGIILEPFSKANTQTYSFAYRKGSSLTATGNLVLRNRKYEGKRDDSDTKLADFKIIFLPFRSGMRGLLNYQISQKKVPQKERKYFRVEEGRGNYIYDEERNEYIPDENGDLILRILPTDSFYSAKEIKIGSSVKMEGRKIFRRDSDSKIYRILRGIRNETVFRNEREIADKPSESFSDGTDIYSRFYFLDDLVLFEDSRDLYMRLRFLNSRTVNNQYYGRNEKINNNEYSFRLRKKISGNTDVQFDIVRRENKKDYVTAKSYTKDIKITRFETLMTIRPEYSYQFSMNFILSREKDVSEQTAPKLTYLSVQPGIRFLLKNKGRFLGELAWSYVDVEPKKILLPYEMADGNREGSNYKGKISFEYRLSNFISANFFYTAKKDAYYKKIYHNLRGELKAYF